jgi:hypothetical protein
MGRSVSTHLNAYETFFLTLPANTGDNEEEYGHDEHAWGDFIEDLKQVLSGTARGGGFPSLRDCDRWNGRENHVILENDHCEISVSEYCGLVAVCLAPQEFDNGYSDDQRRTNLAQGWTSRMCGKFLKELTAAYQGSALVSQGSMSNGEQVFTKPGKTISECCVTSKEGRLW